MVLPLFLLLLLFSGILKSEYHKNAKEKQYRIISETINKVLKELQSWLTRARTQMLTKKKHTHIAKNYHPITCQNLQLKLYNICINTFAQGHCEINNIFTTEQVERHARCLGMSRATFDNQNCFK